MEQQANTTKEVSLYDKLGGEVGLRKIVTDILDRNSNNPQISHYFRNVDMNILNQHVFEFFSMGIGGPHQYTGKDMLTAHTGLHINEKDFDIANDDVVKALNDNKVPEAEQKEIIGILESLREQVVNR
ncbi:group I truncated hemoglobin [Flavihumibacter solisilvae]|uniref:Group 1 truncated hemoglobin n=1 Tax=Flavihumibacter solisilvae TaxID=1349421 RepID=A0A0C1KZH4_9BACT|nr:group 1 truncated hemoglobin [Flavihumibacter solisilvae]KIC92686.1 hypothetical protein OI18_21430 [Flavihumibacter solisilvae]